MPALTVRALQAHEIDWIDLFPGGDALLSRPGFRLNMCRVALVRGEPVAWAQVEPRTLRYGRADLRAVTLHYLYTDPRYRGRGFAQAIMRDVLAFTAEQGAHLILVYSPPGAGLRDFGYGPVWPEYILAFESGSAALLPHADRAVLRPARPADLPHMARLYERIWAGRVTFTRSRERWRWRLERGDLAVLVAEHTSDGSIGGYIAGPDLLGEAVEVVAATPEAAHALMAGIGRRSMDAGITHVCWPVPPDDPLVTFARRSLDVTVSARYARASGWTARLIDTSALVDALLPELEAHARATRPDFNADQLLLDSRADGVAAGLKRGPLCHLDHLTFMQILFGALSPQALVYDGGLNVEGADLLTALFPPRIVALGIWDWG
jgi:ribosomal protein S18 acetylase RimI-like enzyme